MVATGYDKSVSFEEGLRYDLKVLIAPQKERVFMALMDKEKITKRVKRPEHEKSEKEKI